MAVTTINIQAGQTSEVNFVPPGSRITSSGGGTIEWTPGTPTDAKNAPDWTTWAKSNSSGYMDTVRPMSIRAIATGAMTVTIEEGKNDKYGEDAYFEEYLSTDASGNTTLVLAGATLRSSNNDFFANKLARQYMVSDSSLTWTPGTVGTGTVTACTDPVYGAGFKLSLGADAADQAWVDLTNPNGIGWLSDTDNLTAIFARGSNTTSRLAVRLSPSDTDFTTTNNALKANTAYTGPLAIEFDCSANTFSGSGVVLSGNGTLVKGMRVRLDNNGTAAASSVEFYGLWRNRVARKGSIIFEFDDAFLSQYQKAFKYMRTSGVLGNIAVIKETVGQVAGGFDAYDYCSLDQLLSMQEQGWGMSTHGYYPHKTNLATETNIYNDVAANQSYVVQNFGADAGLHYILPAGSESPYTGGVLRRLGFETCRTTQLASVAATPNPSPYFVPSVQVSAFTGLTVLKQWVDRAVKYGATVRFQGHRILDVIGTDTQNEITTADFNALIDYAAPFIRDGRVSNPTVHEWWQRG